MSSSPSSKTHSYADNWRTTDPEPGKPLFGDTYTPTEQHIIERWQMCHTIARYAWNKGLRADPGMVNRHFRVWKLWYSGGLATGYLMHMTGVKCISNDKG